MSRMQLRWVTVRVVAYVGIGTALVIPGIAGSMNARSANLIKNGGFEQPVVTSGSYRLFTTGQSFAGWHVVGASGNVAPISGAFTQNGFRFVAKAGKQWIDMTGLTNTKTGIAQTVRTKKGEKYTLSFAVGNVVDSGGVFGNTSTLNVYVNGRRLLGAENTGGTSALQAWKTFTKNVTATSAATTIMFKNGDPTTDTSNGLDAVSLRKR